MSGPCWIYTGHRDKHGYGVVTLFRTKKMFVHRLAYAIFHPKWGWTECVLHSYDNPPCWNPAHLSNGTQIQNIAEMHARGRAKNPPRMAGASNPRATITVEDVRRIRELFALGMSNREIGEKTSLPRWKVWSVTSGNAWKSIDDGMRAL